MICDLFLRGLRSPRLLHRPQLGQIVVWLRRDRCAGDLARLPGHARPLLTAKVILSGVCLSACLNVGQHILGALSHLNGRDIVCEFWRLVYLRRRVLTFRVSLRGQNSSTTLGRLTRSGSPAYFLLTAMLCMGIAKLDGLRVREVNEAWRTRLGL